MYYTAFSLADFVDNTRMLQASSYSERSTFTLTRDMGKEIHCARASRWYRKPALYHNMYSVPSPSPWGGGLAFGGCQWQITGSQGPHPNGQPLRWVETTYWPAWETPKGKQVSSHFIGPFPRRQTEQNCNDRAKSMSLPATLKLHLLFFLFHCSRLSAPTPPANGTIGLG